MPTKAKLEARRSKVAALLRKGYNIYQIRDEIFKDDPSVSLRQIVNDQTKLINRWKLVQVKDTDKFITVELDRLNQMLAAIWPSALEGNLGAVDRVLLVNKRISELVAELSKKNNDEQLEIELQWTSEEDSQD